MTHSPLVPAIVCGAAQGLPDPSRSQVGALEYRRGHDPENPSAEIEIGFALDSQAPGHPATYRWRTDTTVIVTPNVYIEECVGMQAYLQEAFGHRCDRVEIARLDTTTEDDELVTISAYFK